MKRNKVIFMVVVIVATIMLVSCRGDEFDTNVYEIEFEGYTYLHFEGCGIVHNPDCECKTKHSRYEYRD